MEEQEEKANGSGAIESSNTRRYPDSSPAIGDTPLLIPGAIPAGRVIHPMHGHEGVEEGDEARTRQGGGILGQQEPAGGMVEQGQRVQEEIEDPAADTEVRRSPRVRKQRREKDFHYY